MAGTPKLQKISSVASALALAVGLFLMPAMAQARDIQVFAAFSLKNALEDVAAAYKFETGKTIAASYATSPSLAKQIEAGAPADIFIPDTLESMDYLEARGRIRPETRRNFIGNTLVLIAPRNSAVSMKSADGRIEASAPLAQWLNGGKLAMGEPASVPAGKYGKAALEKLGLWASVEKSVAGAADDRTVLLMVARHEAPLGIVYYTDAMAAPGVTIVGSFPVRAYPSIVYPIALVVPRAGKDSNPNAADFLFWLESGKSHAFFVRQGFFIAP